MPAATASSTTYWIPGLSTRGIISLGVALVAGRKRVPSPAAGMTALRTRMGRLYARDRAGSPAPSRSARNDPQEQGRSTPPRAGTPRRVTHGVDVVDGPARG